MTMIQTEKLSARTSSERRNSDRIARSQPFYWRPFLSGSFESGLMIEGSKSGGAFLIRSKATPILNTMIWTKTGSRESTDMNAALVRRVSTVHGDLSLVAIQYAFEGRSLENSR